MEIAVKLFNPINLVYLRAFRFKVSYIAIVSWLPGTPEIVMFCLTFSPLNYFHCSRVTLRTDKRLREHSWPGAPFFPSLTLFFALLLVITWSSRLHTENKIICRNYSFVLVGLKQIPGRSVSMKLQGHLLLYHQKLVYRHFRCRYLLSRQCFHAPINSDKYNCRCDLCINRIYTVSHRTIAADDSSTVKV